MQDTYALSAPFVFTVANGKLLIDGVETTGYAEVRLRDGLEAGTLTDTNGLPMGLQAASVFKLGTGGNFDWYGGLRSKPDGKIYIPNVDGDYKLHFHNQDMATSYLEEQVVQVAGGSIVNLATLDFAYKQVQVQGEVLGPNNASIPNDMFDVVFTNTTTQENFIAARYDDQYTRFYFSMGGLEDGTYAVSAKPYGSLSMDYTASLPATIEIVNGVASPSNLVLNFEQGNSALLTFTVKSPDGLSTINDVYFTYSMGQTGGGLMTQHANGELRIVTGEDGSYKAVLSSREQDNYAMSEPFAFDIVNGVVYVNGVPSDGTEEK